MKLLEADVCTVQIHRILCRITPLIRPFLRLLWVGLQAGRDKVRTYFGMRKISLGRVPGESNPRIMLNNVFFFQMGVLDQVSCSLRMFRVSALPFALG